MKNLKIVVGEMESLMDVIGGIVPETGSVKLTNLLTVARRDLQRVVEELSEEF